MREKNEKTHRLTVYYKSFFKKMENALFRSPNILSWQVMILALTTSLSALVAA